MLGRQRCESLVSDSTPAYGLRYLACGNRDAGVADDPLPDAILGIQLAEDRYAFGKQLVRAFERTVVQELDLAQVLEGVAKRDAIVEPASQFDLLLSIPRRLHNLTRIEVDIAHHQQRPELPALILKLAVQPQRLLDQRDRSRRIIGAS
jgi:hypothetical protein